MKLQLLLLLIASTFGIATVSQAPVLSQNKSKPSASPQQPRNRNLSGTWITRITYQNCFLMGVEQKLTETNGQVRIKTFATGQNLQAQRVGQRLTLRDKGQVIVLTISADGNRIHYPPQKDGRVIIMHRAGSPGCRNLDHCFSNGCS